MPLPLSLRARLLLGSALIQAAIVALLIASGMRVIEARLEERARLHLAEQRLLLAAAIEGHLRRGDREAISALLERVRRPDDIPYLVLYASGGEVLAASGWNAAEPPPPPDRSFDDPAVSAKGRFDAEVAVGEPSGARARLRFGFSTAFIERARAEMLRDNLADRKSVV